MARTKTNKGSGYNKNKLHYDSDFKWRLCQKYLNGTETKVAVQRRNGVKSRTAIVVWLRQFGLKDKVKTLTLKVQLSLHMPQPKPEKVQLEESELARLKKELTEANLRAEAYQKMIEIAEQEFKIENKKSGMPPSTLPNNPRPQRSQTRNRFRAIMQIVWHYSTSLLSVFLERK